MDPQTMLVAINFMSNSQALNRMSSCHTQLVKLCNNITHQYNPCLSAIYQPIIDSQKSLGWRQRFQGHMALKWSTFQDKYLYFQAIVDNSKSGTMCHTSIITAIWKAFFLMLQKFNNNIHGCKATT
jgi:hypothetical protein